jgi:hypothetical protein
MRDRRDLYLTTHNTPEEKTFMPRAGFEPSIPPSEKPQTHSLDLVAIGMGFHISDAELFINRVTIWQQSHAISYGQHR